MLSLHFPPGPHRVINLRTRHTDIHLYIYGCTSSRITSVIYVRSLHADRSQAGSQITGPDNRNSNNTRGKKKSNKADKMNWSVSGRGLGRYDEAEWNQVRVGGVCQGTGVWMGGVVR